MKNQLSPIIHELSGMAVIVVKDNFENCLSYIFVVVDSVILLQETNVYQAICCNNIICVIIELCLDEWSYLSDKNQHDQ